MIYFLGLISFLILVFISMIHLYWSIGGKWAFKEVLPTKANGKLVLNPKWFDGLFVGVSLLGVAILYGIRIELFKITFLPNWFLNYALYVITIVFIIRAIGDFKYVGFFKKIKETKFANNDTKYFSPLCFFLSIVGALIEFYSV